MQTTVKKGAKCAIKSCNSYNGVKNDFSFFSFPKFSERLEFVHYIVLIFLNFFLIYYLDEDFGAI